VVLFPLSSLGVMVMVYESMLSLKVVMPHPPTHWVGFRKRVPVSCADGSAEDRQCIPGRETLDEPAPREGDLCPDRRLRRPP
jgi:hypothetical protein